MRYATALPAVAALLVLAGSAAGEVIVLGAHSSAAAIPGSQLGDVRMSVDLSVSGGLATFAFQNASTGLETSAVLRRIVIDTYDDDTGEAILWDAQILTHSSDVRYRLMPSKGLPGYRPQTHDAMPLVELRAEVPAPRKGLGPGELLMVSFRTNLPDGAGMEGYLAAFGGGDDTGLYALGFQAINASILNGGSLSGMNNGSEPVPEPATMALVLIGGLASVVRRSRRQSREYC